MGVPSTTRIAVARLARKYHHPVGCQLVLHRSATRTRARYRIAKYMQLKDCRIDVLLLMLSVLLVQMLKPYRLLLCHQPARLYARWTPSRRTLRCRRRMVCVARRLCTPMCTNLTHLHRRLCLPTVDRPSRHTVDASSHLRRQHHLLQPAYCCLLPIESHGHLQQLLLSGR